MITTSVLAGVTDPLINSIIILNGVFHEQQLLIIVTCTVRLFSHFFSREWKPQTCMIFECISGGGGMKFLF